MSLFLGTMHTLSQNAEIGNAKLLRLHKLACRSSNHIMRARTTGCTFCLIVCFSPLFADSATKRLRSSDHEAIETRDVPMVLDLPGPLLLPRSRHLQTTTASVVGNNGVPSSAFPLGLCQGDCDNDRDCVGNYVCFQRSGSEPVPGCRGLTRAMNGEDFCYDPSNTPAGTLAVVGNNGSPSSAFPLGLCLGDCDNDRDCQGNYVCFQRRGSEAVPGCSGLTSDLDGDDFCYDPSNASSSSLVVVGNDGSPSSSFPLGKCQGDCDGDRECQGDLQCFQRSSGTSSVPGCEGSATGSTDFCYDPNDAPSVDRDTLARVGNDGSPSSVFPLAKCLGDCDRDSECEGSLRCFQRNAAISSVPGCMGVATGSTDYCYDPSDVANPVPSPTSPPSPTSSLELSTVGNDGEPSSIFPLRQCQGDCDNNSECRGDLICFQRDSGNSVPGCTGRPLNDGTDYCVEAKSVLDTVGNDYNPRDPFPLSLCQGDCDGDFDCEGDLVCHQRDAMDPVPSCVGQGTFDVDYCIKESDETARPPEAGAFRLKMYWEFGYDWQEVFWEEEWCLTCDVTGCEEGMEMMLETCDDKVDWFTLEHLNAKGQAMFKIAGADLCLDLEDVRMIRLRPCNRDDIRQKFTAGMMSFTDEAFEIQTIENQGCLSQSHDPRAGERILRVDCDKARGDQTSLWNKY